MIKQLNTYDTLYKILAPYLIHTDVIMDLGCGISPLAEFMVNDFEYIGIDNDPDVIAEAKEIFPNGKWKLEDYKSLPFYNIDVLLFLGSSFRPYFASGLTDVVKMLLPRIVVIEMSMYYRFNGDKGYKRRTRGIHENFAKFVGFMISINYDIVEKGTHKKPRETENTRYYQIFKQKANYESK